MHVRVTSGLFADLAVQTDRRPERSACSSTAIDLAIAPRGRGPTCPAMCPERKILGARHPHHSAGFNMRHVHVALVAAAVVAAGTAIASPPPDGAVRVTVERFVAAQNAHDIKAVEGLLSDSSDFLWITRGTAVWGRSDALARFENLYAGTWHLEPDWAAFRLVIAQPQVAEIFVPIDYSIGAADQPPQQTRFLMNMVLTKSASGWRVASILPVPVPPPSK